jgi:hypothetical protein
LAYHARGCADTPPGQVSVRGSGEISSYTWLLRLQCLHILDDKIHFRLKFTAALLYGVHATLQLLQS